MQNLLFTGADVPNVVQSCTYASHVNFFLLQRNCKLQRIFLVILLNGHLFLVPFHTPQNVVAPEKMKTKSRVTKRLLKKFHCIALISRKRIKYYSNKTRRILVKPSQSSKSHIIYSFLSQFKYFFLSAQFTVSVMTVHVIDLSFSSSYGRNSGDYLNSDQ